MIKCKGLLILFILFSLHVQVIAQNRVQEVLNGYIDSVSNYGIIALVADDNGVTIGAIGMADDTTRMTDEHLMCIGSVTKTYTSTLIFILQDKGLLSIHDSIGKYVDLNNQYIDQSITIKQLLNHTSGIKDFGTSSLLNEVLSQPKRLYTSQYCIDQIDTVDFIKGSKHEYSNSNYLILGLIIESVTQLPLEVAFRKLLFDKYNLKETVPYFSIQTAELAHPMFRDQDLFEEALLKPVNDVSRGDGNIVTSAKELYQFFKLLLQDYAILSDNSYSDMLTLEKAKRGRMYGCGIFSKDVGGEHVLYHTGRQVSYIATCIYIQDMRKFVIVLTNNMDDTYADLVVNELVGAKFY